MFVMKDNKVGPAHLKIASSPSYTLTEIEQLAELWCNLTDNRHTRSDALQRRLTLSIFIEWLAQREQGKGGGG